MVQGMGLVQFEGRWVGGVVVVLIERGVEWADGVVECGMQARMPMSRTQKNVRT